MTSTAGPLVVHVDEPPAGTAEERRTLLGGKGAALVDLHAGDMPVPPAFVLTTEAFRHHRRHGWDDALEAALARALARLESTTGKRLGDPSAPLLVSVRSGAAVSMPGMMDTVLDAGMTPDVHRALARLSGDEAFASDTARRATESFTEVVGADVPSDPVDQIRDAVRAVFASWDRPRARTYREVEGIDHELGTAATVQAMVFGNLGDRSGTGVAFTRDPATGERRLMGDFLPGAQGEDVVAGGRATLSLDAMAHAWPDEHADLVRIADRLERESADLVDLEFTVEGGRLWVLQARRGKRSPIATFRIAIDMAEDPDFPLDRAGAVERCQHLFDDPPTVTTHEAGTAEPVARGLAASPGRGSGILCLDPDEAVELEAAGQVPVLARTATSPADVHGMAVAAGLFTTLGGLVSHAAVVARDWGIPAVVGAGEATIEDGGVRGPGGFVAAGELVTVDGDRGVLLPGGSAAGSEPAPEVHVVRRWAAELDGEVATATAPLATELDDAPLLHALAVKGMGTPEALAPLVGRDPASMRADLIALRDAGLATHMEARDLWRLSQDGRSRHAEFLAGVRATRDLAALPYDDFLGLNDRFKAVCADWQMRGGEPNDHTDTDHDAAVLQRLDDIHEAIAAMLPGIAGVLPWTAGYADRLEAAHRRVGDGDQRALTGVMCDSYHDVWMELHEDLLLVQGIDRAEEGSG